MPKTKLPEESGTSIVGAAITIVVLIQISNSTVMDCKMKKRLVTYGSYNRLNPDHTLAPGAQKVEYWFIESSAGKERSKRPKQKGDCTVLALAHCEGRNYDDAYDFMKKLGRKCFEGFHLDKAYLNDSESYQAHSFPAVKRQPRMTVWEFCIEHPSGRYILRTAKHVTCVIDGVLYDSWEQDPNRCVYKAWEYLEDVRS